MRHTSWETLVYSVKLVFIRTPLGLKTYYDDNCVIYSAAEIDCTSKINTRTYTIENVY